RQKAATALTGWLTQLEAGSDNQTTTARTLARLARAGVAEDVVDAFLASEPNQYGVKVDEQLQWLSWQALAASRGLDESDEVRMRAALDANPTSVAQNAMRTALAARPVSEVKEQAFAQVLQARDQDGELSNDALSATAEGFTIGPRELLAGFEERYWPQISEVFDSMSMEFSTRVIRGLFPRSQELSEEPDDNPALKAVTEWLEKNTEAPRALRRILLEERAELQRSLDAQKLSRQTK
ncbi:aminopeptidase N, partial [Glutamicibacter creatinolyticus]